MPKPHPSGRRLMAQQLADGWSTTQVAAAFGVTPKTVAKWRARYAQGRRSRPGRPLVAAARQPEPAGRCRRGRDPGAASPAPVRTGHRSPARPPGRHRGPGPAPPRARPARRPRPQARDRPLPARAAGRVDPYRHQEARQDRRHRSPHHRRPARPEKRGIGWDFLHVCVDDASRLAYTEILPDERKESAVAFLERAMAWFTRLGVTVERVMTDNGSAYRSHAFRQAPALPACQA